MAWQDAAPFLPVRLIEEIGEKKLWDMLPLAENLDEWVTFGVFGIKPIAGRFGEWCGCVKMEWAERGIHCRLFHKFNMENERRVVMIWDEDHANEGFVVAVDGFKTMKEFFRNMKDASNVESVKGVMN